MTERLYYTDAYLREFEAEVVERVVVGDKVGLVLNRSAFYPTSGGQPHDTGYLNGVALLEVIEREEDGHLVHLLADEGEMKGRTVRGVIDWARRFDHMQQHTGQHILSQVFFQLKGAETVGFHLGEKTSTIDLEGALTSADLETVEEAANDLVLANRPVRTYFLSQEEVSRLPLRKPPSVEGAVRIVEVEDFDYSPCGGTHCRSTGEIGLIAIQRAERRGEETRIEFLCGRRALADYRRKNLIVGELAHEFSVGAEELVQAVLRLREQAKIERRLLNATRDRLLDHEAARLVAEAEEQKGVRIVRAIFAARPEAHRAGGCLPWNAETIKRLALRLMEYPACVALLGLKADKAQLTFARSDDVVYDMKALLKEAGRIIGGGGGGQPHFAQGGGSRPERLEEALAAAYQTLSGSL